MFRRKLGNRHDLYFRTILVSQGYIKIMQRIQKLDFSNQLNYYNKKAFLEKSSQTQSRTTASENIDTPEQENNENENNHPPNMDYSEKFDCLEKNHMDAVEIGTKKDLQLRLKTQESIEYDDWKRKSDAKNYNEQNNFNPEENDKQIETTQQKLSEKNEIAPQQNEACLQIKFPYYDEAQGVKPLNYKHFYQKDKNPFNKTQKKSQCFKKHPHYSREGRSSIDIHRYTRRFHNYGSPKSSMKQVKFSSLCRITEAAQSQFDFY